MAKNRTPLSESLPTPAARRKERKCDILVVGAGAAGLLAALSARGAVDSQGRIQRLAENAPDVVILNNELRLGLKILVSGGSRCNVTNAKVVDRDYETDAPHLVRRILKGFPPTSIRTFFESQGCPLYEEPMGKVFPQSDDARDILRILLEAIVRARIPLIAPAEVIDIVIGDSGIRVDLADGNAWRSRRVILATGGKSLPKTGSRGFGLDLLARKGHEIAPTLPALTPLLFKETGPLKDLPGLTVPVVLTLAPDGTLPSQITGRRFKPLARAGGSLLVTHQGATGPAPFDVSGLCGREIDDGDVSLTGDFWSLTEPDGPWAPYLNLPKAPGASLAAEEVPRPPTLEAFKSQAQSLFAHRERGIGSAFSNRIPRSLLQALLRNTDIDQGQPMKQLDKTALTQLWLALTQADLRLAGCEGYAKAEVTSGGVRLSELFPASLESRVFKNLFCCGEIIHATGRLGGFNFQWAWSSGYAVGVGAAKSLVAGKSQEN